MVSHGSISILEVVLFDLMLFDVASRFSRLKKHVINNDKFGRWLVTLLGKLLRTPTITVKDTKYPTVAK